MSVDGPPVAPVTRPTDGFCVIRVEAERRGLLIVLVLNPDRGQVSTLRTRTARDVEEAVRIVRAFLEEFVTDSTQQSE